MLISKTHVRDCMTNIITKIKILKMKNLKKLSRKELKKMVGGNTYDQDAPIDDNAGGNEGGAV